jgi:hypothetical protein
MYTSPLDIYSGARSVEFGIKDTGKRDKTSERKEEEKESLLKDFKYG